MYFGYVSNSDYDVDTLFDEDMLIAYLFFGITCILTWKLIPYLVKKVEMKTKAFADPVFNKEE
jgi:hypothetical protein